LLLDMATASTENQLIVTVCWYEWPMLMPIS